MTDSKISWTTKTWNPTTGCDRVSPGCDHCYALTLAARLKGMGNPRYQNDGNPKTSGPGFALTLHHDKLDEPLKWRKPARVFVNSMSDLFHDDVPSEFIVDVFAAMALTRRHSFQVLTKRPRRMRDMALSRKLGFDPLSPPPNVWLGTSVEDQKAADLRIPLLLETPAAVRFLSCEPLLGPVDIFDRGDDGHDIGWLQRHDGIHWVIVGGESGSQARPMHPDWARSLRDQCVAAGVPFFFKQWGQWRWTREAVDSAYEQELKLHNGENGADLFPNAKWEIVRSDGSIKADNIPSDDSTVMQKVGKKKAGRELDGRTWSEMPDEVSA